MIIMKERDSARKSNENKERKLSDVKLFYALEKKN